MTHVVTRKKLIEVALPPEAIDKASAQGIRDTVGEDICRKAGFLR